MIDSLVKLRGSIFSKFSAIQALLWRFTSARNLTIRSTARPVKPKSGQLPNHQVDCSPKLRSFSRKDWIIQPDFGRGKFGRVHGKRERRSSFLKHGSKCYFEKECLLTYNCKKNFARNYTRNKIPSLSNPSNLTHLSKQSNFTHLSNLSTYRLSEKLYIPVTSNPSIYLSYQSDLSF